MYGLSVMCPVFDFQVLPYGSVPLRTYLPDGDIDLTVLANPNAEDALISDIHDVLKREEWNRHAAFEVKAVQLISAEVCVLCCVGPSLEIWTIIGTQLLVAKGNCMSIYICVDEET